MGGRGLPPGERVVRELHPHARVLIVPAVTVPLVVGLAAYAAAVLPAGRWQQPGRLAVAAVAGLLLIWRSVLPWLRWRTTSYLLTTDRLVTRRGVVARSGRDLPLRRVSDVGFAQSAVERLWGCGTLVVESAGEHGRVVLADVPRVRDVQRELLELLEPPDDRSLRG